jgi:hypothetical protein
MFFGYDEKPEFLNQFVDLEITRKQVNVCSRDKGECRGELPLTQSDGSIKWVYLYSDGTTDDGIWVDSCRAVIGDNIFAWTE